VVEAEILRQNPKDLAHRRPETDAGLIILSDSDATRNDSHR